MPTAKGKTIIDLLIASVRKTFDNTYLCEDNIFR